MADNVTLNSGSGGSVVRTDDDGAAHWQYVKVAYGADNTQNIVGSISSNPFPVALSDTDNAVLDQIEVNTSYGDSVGGGTEAAALRVTLANDSTGVLSVDDNAGSLTVDNDGTFAVQISDTSFAVADGNALGEGVLIQGDDGTDRKNINVDATTGDVQVDVTNTVTVDLGANNDVTVTSGSITETNSGAALTALQLLDNAVSGNGYNITQMNGVNVTMGNGASGTGVQRVSLASDSTGNIATIGTSVTPGTGAANLGKAEDAVHSSGDTGVMSLAVSAASPTARAGAAGDYQPLSVSSTNGALFTQQAAATTGGTTFYLNQDTNAVASVKASAGTVYSICCFNTHTAAVYLNLYNVASGSVTLGTTTPSMQFVVPTQGATASGGGFVINFGPQGVAFGTAITVACATTYNGSADPGSNLVITNITYA